MLNPQSYYSALTYAGSNMVVEDIIKRVLEKYSTPIMICENRVPIYITPGYDGSAEKTLKKIIESAKT